MKCHFFLFTCFLFAVSFSFGQKSYTVNKSLNEIKIDGFLTEDQWLKADVATDFVVTSPVYGEKSKFISIVKMYYDDNAFYIAGELHDPHPDSVSYSMSQRDDF